MPCRIGGSHGSRSWGGPRQSLMGETPAGRRCLLKITVAPFDSATLS
ncbi:hypothetical protein [Moorena producens]|nr:hypothetical protein [Moorena producens]